mmetsp:Transcript_19993/g.29943  ORF Transcript_19993/g.29943 Transcript_19993/m.29943 type:complete len:80 (-) Transcript_19993:834-1073(-)
MLTIFNISSSYSDNYVKKRAFSGDADHITMLTKAMEYKLGLVSLKIDRHNARGFLKATFAGMHLELVASTRSNVDLPLL